MKLVTPKQAGRVLNVSEATIKRWCDQGHLAAEKTQGGHRRIAVPEIIHYARTHGRHLAETEVLNIPSVSGHTDATIKRSLGDIENALHEGQAEKLSSIVFALYLNGHSVAEIGDLAISPAFRKIGEMWHCGDLNIYQERRACQICRDVLARLRENLPDPGSRAQMAIGGSISGDHYEIPNALIETVFRENRIWSQCTGVNLPLESLAQLARDKKPNYLWMSLSESAPWTSSFIEQFNELYESLASMGCALVIGGRALSEKLRKQIKYSVFCDDLRRLESFIKASTSLSRGGA